MMKQLPFSFHLLLFMMAFTNALNIATNFGLCATYAATKIGVPVTFVRCNPKDIRQSTWIVNPTEDLVYVLFCINSEQNLCIGINTATGIAQLVNQNREDPAQQFAPFRSTRRFINRLFGNTECASVVGRLLIMTECSPKAPLQQLFIYGPDSRTVFNADIINGEDYQQQQFESYDEYNRNSPAPSFFTRPVFNPFYSI